VGRADEDPIQHPLLVASAATEKAAVDDIGPLVARGAEELALDRAGTERLGELLAEAWFAGAGVAAQDEAISKAVGFGARAREGVSQLPGKRTK
jgi:ABC-type xylose transport system substrate-binding protein